MSGKSSDTPVDINLDVAPTRRVGIYDATGNQMTLEPNGSLPVTLQDQTSPLFLVKASRVIATSTLLSAAAKDDRTIQVTDITGMLVGFYLGLFNPITNRYYVGNIVSILPGAGVTGALEMDRLLDSGFDASNIVGTGTTDLASLAGSAANPIIYTIRGADPGLAITIDLTRVVVTCLTTAAVELNQFGDQAALTYGITIRSVNGQTYNIDNWKTNLEMMGTMYDWDSLDNANPGPGIHGFKGRLTWASQGKMGATIRIGPGEALEIYVQDAQVADLLLLEFKFEGSEVIP